MALPAATASREGNYETHRNEAVRWVERNMRKIKGRAAKFQRYSPYDLEDFTQQAYAAALAAVDMAGYENRATHTLSGGQKQRVALAGVLALSPDILVFDEATAMLDPDGRQEVLHTIHRLHTQQHKTVVMITHYIEEAIGADRVYLIHNGKMIADGTAREMLTQPELLAAAGLTPPMPVQMYHDLKQAGIVLARCPLTLEELAEELCRSQ